MQLNLIGKLALLLVIIGGLNWGLVGIFDFDLVRFILGSVPLLQRLIYVLVAISAIYLAIVGFMPRNNKNIL